MTDDVYPEGAVLACVHVTKPLTLADNKTCPCEACGMMVQYRHYVPDRVTKLCLRCVVKAIEMREAAGKEVEIATTKRALVEAALFLHKGRKQ